LNDTGEWLSKWSSSRLIVAFELVANAAKAFSNAHHFTPLMIRKVNCLAVAPASFLKKNKQEDLLFFVVSYRIRWCHFQAI